MKLIASGLIKCKAETPQLLLSSDPLPLYWIAVREPKLKMTRLMVGDWSFPDSVTQSDTDQAKMIKPFTLYLEYSVDHFPHDASRIFMKGVSPK